MNSKHRNKRYMIMIQCIIWLCIIILPPIITTSASGRYAEIPLAILHSFRNYIGMVILYFTNYLLLAPKLLFVDGRKKWFYIANLAIYL